MQSGRGVGTGSPPKMVLTPSENSRFSLVGICNCCVMCDTVTPMPETYAIIHQGQAHFVDTSEFISPTEAMSSATICGLHVTKFSEHVGRTSVIADGLAVMVEGFGVFTHEDYEYDQLSAVTDSICSVCRS